jgi:hypothetical protein
MAKATHSGTCQVCGCFQKLPNGDLSKHGYTTRWGFFEGVCMGSHNKPFEQSTDLIEKAIKEVRGQMVALEAHKLELTVMADCMVELRWFDRRRGEVIHHWAKAPLETMSLGGWTGNVLESSYTEQFYTRYGKETFVSEYIHCGLEQKNDYKVKPTKEELIRRANKHYIDTVINSRLKDMSAYLDWQEERVANWVEQPLTPVTK